MIIPPKGKGKSKSGFEIIDVKKKVNEMKERKVYWKKNLLVIY